MFVEGALHFNTNLTATDHRLFMMYRFANSTVNSIMKLVASYLNLIKTVLQKSKMIGHYIGMSFQIIDDVLDFTDSKTSGKPGRK